MKFKTFLKKENFTPMVVGVGLSALTLITSFNSFAAFDFRLPGSVTPLQQNIYWEQQANVLQYRKQTSPLKMKLVPYRKKDVEMTIAGNGQISKEAQKVLDTFYDKHNKTVYFPVHPRNESHSIHWAEKEHLLKSELRDQIKEIDIAETASRTVYFVDKDAGGITGESALVAVKSPTDRLVNDKGVVTEQTGKIYLGGSVKSSLEMNDIISIIDAHINPDPHLILMKEIGWFRLKRKVDAQRNGFMLRDISPLANGNYFLPAFSIPYEGGNIARYNGEAPFNFWQKHFAYAQGRLKAKLLLRYGVQMITPNSQNFLIEMDTHFKPTGTIAMRDVEDTWFVPAVTKQVLAAHNIDSTFLRHWKCGKEPYNFLRPFWSNSAWKFNDSQDKAYKVPYKVLSTTWFRAQLQGYLDEVNESLNTNIMPLSFIQMKKSAVKKYIKHVKTFQNYPGIKEEVRFTKPVIDFLMSPEGEIKLKEFHRIISQH